MVNETLTGVDVTTSKNGGSAGSAKASPFSHDAPEGAAKSVSQVFGEVVWLMSQSPLHKNFFISDLEWMSSCRIRAFSTGSR